MLQGCTLALDPWLQMADKNQYYEAIGELPRFNAGPAWNDAPQQAGTSNGDFMQEHQNKVSRHRETVSGTGPAGSSRRNGGSGRRNGG